MDLNLGIKLNPFADSDLLFAQQLGVTHIIADVPAWDYKTLASASNRVEKSGLRMASLVCLPVEVMRDALLDPPACDFALERVNEIITNAGELGIPSVEYALPYGYPKGAGEARSARGAAVSSHYLMPRSNRDIEFSVREVLWLRLSHFLQCVLPTAEAAGVHLTFQTDSATFTLPDENRILDSTTELERLFQVAPSVYHGLDLDHGYLELAIKGDTTSPMTDVIQHLGKQTRILVVRLQNLRQTGDGFEGVFLDEDKVKVLHALRAYQASGFAGTLCPIPAVVMTNDTAWQHKGIAFSVGYVRGLLQVLGG
ncbi:MAG: mannonate dehydratase [Anaerolineae bacterium]|nr:mannonate dehydratase [Anaerolineae bacterium]